MDTLKWLLLVCAAILTVVQGCNTDFTEQYAFVGDRAVIRNTQGLQNIMKWYNIHFAVPEQADRSRKAVTYINGKVMKYITDFDFNRNTGNLIIPRTRLLHEGNYTLSTGESTERRLSFNLLHVYYRHRDLIITPGNPNIQAGVVITFTCVIRRVKPLNATFRWFLLRDTEEPPSTMYNIKEIISHDKTNHKFGDGTYVVRNYVKMKFTYKDHRKRLWCVTVHGVDKSIRRQKSVQINITYAPIGSPVIQPDHIAAKLGRKYELKCKADSLIAPGYPQFNSHIWYRNDTRLPNTEEVIEVSYDLVTDGATYGCRARNRVGSSDISKRVIVTVDAPLVIDHEPYKIGAAVYTPHFDDGTFHLKFTVSGGRNINVFILKSEMPVDRSDFAITRKNISGYFPNRQRSALSVILNWQIAGLPMDTCDQVRYYDGNYTLLVNGTEGAETTTKRADFNLDVQYPAMWSGDVSLHQPSRVDINKTLICSVCTNPHPSTYLWSFEGGDLPLGAKPDGEALHIIGVNESLHFGTYTCTVVNLLSDRTKQQRIFDIVLTQMSNSVSSSVIAWIIVGCLLGVALVIGGIFLVRKYMRQNKLKGGSFLPKININREECGNTWRILPKRTTSETAPGPAKKRPLSTISKQMIGEPILNHHNPMTSEYDDVYVSKPKSGEKPSTLNPITNLSEQQTTRDSFAPDDVYDFTISTQGLRSGEKPSTPEPVYNLYEQQTPRESFAPDNVYDFTISTQGLSSGACVQVNEEPENLYEPIGKKEDHVYDDLHIPIEEKRKLGQEKKATDKAVAPSKKFKPAERSDLVRASKKIK